MEMTVNQWALCAHEDDTQREELIRAHTQQILRVASGLCRRYVTQSDDEWSVALWGFSRAVDEYRSDRGDFLPFAKTVIRRELIDYYRKERSHASEVAVAPHVLAGEATPEEDGLGVTDAVAAQSCAAADDSLRQEIEAVTGELQCYGICFFDLAECSPRQDKTRRQCAAAIRCALDNDLLCEEILRTGKLPIKALTQAANVPAKTLDRYRRYILMALVVLTGDYPHLAGYLRFVREEDRP